MIDLFTKFGVSAPMPDQSAQTVADTLFARRVLHIGAPRRLLTDQGANFDMAIVQNLCTLWRIDKVRSTAYHPAAMGRANA